MSDNTAAPAPEEKPADAAAEDNVEATPETTPAPATEGEGEAA